MLTIWRTYSKAYEVIVQGYLHHWDPTHCIEISPELTNKSLNTLQKLHFWWDSVHERNQHNKGLKFLHKEVCWKSCTLQWASLFLHFTPARWTYTRTMIQHHKLFPFSIFLYMIWTLELQIVPVHHTGNSGSSGFILGVHWRSLVNAHLSLQIYIFFDF